MERSSEGWSPAHREWGLLDCATRSPLVPPDLVNDELIEMTDWELHDFAVQTVRNVLEKDGREVMSAQGNPHVDPSLWFVGDHGPEWVVVRATRYPEKEAQPPKNWDAISASCRTLSERGNFASVAVASAENSFGSNADPAPLWRDHGMYVSYQGLSPRR
jgi:hypothetical protein